MPPLQQLKSGSSTQIVQSAELNPSPAVSVIVPTYNQEGYLRQAVESILDQTIADELEIVIAEDCSTDATREVGFALQAAHPRHVKLVYSAENVGINRNFRRAFTEARGLYVAICEGDDFWISPVKLERQLAALTERPEIGLAITAAYKYIENTGELLDWSFGETARIMTLQEIFSSDEGLVPTASTIAKRESLVGMPAWFDKAPVADWFILIAVGGAGIVYQPERTVCYRLNSTNSFSAAWQKSTRAAHVEYAEKMVQLLAAARRDYGLPASALADRVDRFHLEIGRFHLDEKKWISALNSFAQIKPSFILRAIARKVLGKAIPRRSEPPQLAK